MSAREPNNPLRPNKSPRRKIHPGIKLLNLFHILILLPSPIFFFASLFMLDAPDAESSPLIIIAMLIWAYPVITIVCLILSRQAEPPKKGLLIAAIPFAVVFLIFALFSAA